MRVFEIGFWHIRLNSNTKTVAVRAAHAKTRTSLSRPALFIQSYKQLILVVHETQIVVLLYQMIRIIGSIDQMGDFRRFRWICNHIHALNSLRNRNLSMHSIFPRLNYHCFMNTWSVCVHCEHKNNMYPKICNHNNVWNATQLGNGHELKIIYFFSWNSYFIMDLATTRYDKNYEKICNK